MEYFKKCPECGRYMTPHLRYVYGQAFTIYSCLCGYSEDTCGCRYDNKTTYTGGGTMTERITSDFDTGKMWELIEQQKPYSKVYRKLQEYETAEEDGRLMIFPCKVGDVVYVTERRYYNYSWHTGVQKGRVYGFECDKGWIIWVSLEGDNASSRNAYKFENIGKTVFFTHEEAEKALEEMKKNNATN